MPMSRFSLVFLGEYDSVRVRRTNRNVVIVGEEALSDREIDICGGFQKTRYANSIALGDTILNWEGRGGFVLRPP